MTAQLTDMIDSVAKTFAIAHDQDSDAHLAQALVYNAGRLAWRIREQGLNPEEKTGASDLVTEADKAAEQFVKQVITALRPEDGILGEEGTNIAGTSGRRWVIDPVDGTYNFASGSDYFCSALALETPEGLLGAVHRPAMGYTWFADAQTPTSRDTKPVQVQQTSDLAHASVITYLHPKFYGTEVAQVWENVAKNAATVRMLGSGSIDLASVADGTWGVWLQHSVPDWDWLPGKALVEGAGGATNIVTAGGVDWFIAGNKQLVTQVSELLQQ